MKIENEFIPYEQALALKELGFDEPCITFYPVDLTVPLYGVYATLGLNGKYSLLKDGYKNSTVNILWTKRYKRDYANVTAPTYSQAFRWFRDNHKIYCTIEICSQHKLFNFFISDSPSTIRYCSLDELSEFTGYSTYEDAELDCLIKLIEIVKKD